MDEEDVGQMLDGIEKIAQCPVCLELAKAPVAQCTNGHIFCGECREPLNECSVCRDPFIPTINRIVQELLNFLPKPCPYTNKGCDAVSLLENHSQYCEFRPIKCLVGKDQSCAWSGTISDWKDHVKTEHNDFYIVSIFKKPNVLAIDDFNGDWHSCCFCLCIDNEIFLFHVWKDGNKFCHILKHVQCKKTKKEYYMKVKFVSQELLFYKSLIPSTPFKGDDPLEVNAVIFLLMDLQNITNKDDGKVNVEVEVLELDMPKKEIAKQKPEKINEEICEDSKEICEDSEEIDEDSEEIDEYSEETDDD